jgi:3',5'-cyclic-AMP phosphodiesterase
MIILPKHLNSIGNEMYRRLAWLTDIHLNFLKPHQYNGFFGKVRAYSPDALVITGDIGEGRSIGFFLQTLDKHLQMPMYFVLGNHDYYYGSFKLVSALMRKMCAELPRLSWLDEAGVVELTPDTALIGHGSWPDGRFGTYHTSEVELLDYYVIEEFVGLDKQTRLGKLNALGDAAASHFRRVLPQALQQYKHVYAAMHAPPFREASRYKGQISKEDFLPHFTSKAVGEALREIMLTHPEHTLTVLCGHTHGAADERILPNLHVLTGEAEYGKPVVQKVFDLH